MVMSVLTKAVDQPTEQMTMRYLEPELNQMWPFLTKPIFCVCYAKCIKLNTLCIQSPSQSSGMVYMVILVHTYQNKPYN